MTAATSVPNNISVISPESAGFHLKSGKLFVFSCDRKNCPLRDVCRMIADSLKILGNHQQVCRLVGAVGIFLDNIDQFLFYLYKQIINNIIMGNCFPA